MVCLLRCKLRIQRTSVPPLPDQQHEATGQGADLVLGGVDLGAIPACRELMSCKQRGAAERRKSAGHVRAATESKNGLCWAELCHVRLVASKRFTDEPTCSLHDGRDSSCQYRATSAEVLADKPAATRPTGSFVRSAWRPCCPTPNISSVCRCPIMVLIGRWPALVRLLRERIRV